MTCRQLQVQLIHVQVLCAVFLCSNKRTPNVETRPVCLSVCDCTVCPIFITFSTRVLYERLETKLEFR